MVLQKCAWLDSDVDEVWSEEMRRRGREEERSTRSRHAKVTWFWRALTCAVTLSDLGVALCASRTVRTLSGVVSGVVRTPHHPDLPPVEVSVLGLLLDGKTIV